MKRQRARLPPKREKTGRPASLFFPSYHILEEVDDVAARVPEVRHIVVLAADFYPLQRLLLRSPPRGAVASRATALAHVRVRAERL